MIAININHKDKNYQGNYKIEDGLVSVTYDFFNKKAQLGNLNSEVLAKRILREIIDDNNL